MESTLQLLSYLNRGGPYGYYWVKSPSGPNHTEWFSTRAIPEPMLNGSHLYWGVNPSRVNKGAYQRATLEDIAAVNCLFGDFDAKDFEGSKEKALEHINSLTCPPSVLVDSGGGYQAYWLLKEPYKIENPESAARIRELQGRWVAWVGSDPGAKDLARVLRVPGSKNYKYDPPREVKLLWADYKLIYWMDDFFSFLPSQPQHPAERQAPQQPAPSQDDIINFWLDRALARAGVGSRANTGFWLAQQLNDHGISQAAALSVPYWQRVPQPSGDPYTQKEWENQVKSAYKLPARGPAHKIGGGASRMNNQQQDSEEIPQNRGIPPSEEIPYQFILDCKDQQETGDANLFAKMFQGKICYDHAESAWYIWKGHYWAEDTTGLAVWLVARALAPQYIAAAATALEAEKDKLSEELIKRAAALRNRKRIENILYLAARLESLSLSGDEWDKNPWLLGCENGVIELTTGKFRAGQPEDYIRSHAPISWPGLDAQCPRWEKFIAEIFDNNTELASFMARLLGYGITGLTNEHVLPILWGNKGRNGKSTMLETLGDVLGKDLAISSQADALMDLHNTGGGPQPFIWALRGKRLVWASESNEGRRVNAGLVKQLTGGDRLNVRTLHTKPVEFKPTHLLMLLTNHKPHISADDSAIWERVLLIPFSLQFIDNPQGDKERKCDKNLTTTLRAEAPAILAWLVRGCLWWQQAGLNPPKSVSAATAEYREEEDTTGAFIADRCLTGSTYKVRGADLYKAYVEWCQENGIPPMSNTALGGIMKLKFNSKRSDGIVYQGIGLVK